jgi:histidine triad (HIT) family protein
MDACVFCRIAKGEIPSHKVHEDADTLAFLDIRPLAKGHALVIPKRHAKLYQELPADALAALARATSAVAAKAQKATGAPATTIAINNGPEAGQEVPHVHVHVVPRLPGDRGGPVHALFTERPQMAAEELAALAKRMRDN